MSIANARQTKLRLKDNGFSFCVHIHLIFFLLDDAYVWLRIHVVVDFFFSSQITLVWVMKRTKFNKIYIFIKRMWENQCMRCVKCQSPRMIHRGACSVDWCRRKNFGTYFDNHLMRYAHRNLSKLSQLCWNLITWMCRKNFVKNL